MDAVTSLQAVHDITHVIHEYARLVDLNRTAEQAMCFTDDGVADYYGSDVVGRDAIAALLGPAVDRWIASCHTISNIQIELVSATSATSVCYVHAWHRVDPSGAGDFEVRGQYHDVWRVTAEGWRIARRTFLTMAGTPPRPDAPGIGRVPRGGGTPSGH